MTATLVAQIGSAFAADTSGEPPLSLRGGNDVDGYEPPTPFDPEADRLDDAYIDAFAYWALPHLDPASWRHYLGPLLVYAVEHRADGGSLVVQGVIWSLWPPERDPPRFGSLDAPQTAAVVAFLEFMALDEASAHQEDAARAIDDWWGRAPGAYPTG